jgi:transcriptional regulator with XRE-family HTH domain
MPRTTRSDVASKVVGNAVRDARLAAGISQSELARRLGVSPPYVVRIERGQENPTAGQLFNIASALGAAFRLSMPILESRVELP